MFRLALQATVLATVTAALFAADPEPKLAPQIAEGGVVNAAGFALSPDGYVAPGSIISIFGVDLAPIERAVRAGDLVGSRLPRLLAGVEVQINGLAAPLFYVSPGQLNCQTPVEIRPREAPYDLRVVFNNETSQAFALRVGTAAPGLFPVVAHQDFSVVGRGEGETPAEPGELIVLFGSGFGPTSLPLASGQFADRAAPLALPVRVLIDGVALPSGAVLYAGLAPGFAGLYQVNLFLPADPSSSDVEAVVEVDGIPSPTGVMVAVGSQE